jgi:hypothetical protein
MEDQNWSDVIKKQNPLKEGLVYGRNFTVSDLQPGMAIVRLQSGYSGRVVGTLIKINRITYDIESFYGGWGGKEPEKIQFRLRFDEPGTLLVRDGNEVHVVID